MARINPGLEALGALFAELADGIAVADARGRILYLNAAAERLLGVTLAEAKGGSLCALLCSHLWSSAGARCSAGCPLREPAGGRTAVTFQGRYGPKVAFEWRMPAIHKVENWKNLRVRCLRLATPWPIDGKGEKHLVSIEDVSAEVELEKRKEDWRSMIAHDLRTPLSSIHATLRLLEESAGRQSPPPAEAKLIGGSLSACSRMLELLNLYLDLARLDAGLMPVAPERLSLADAARRCVEEQAAFAGERRIKVAVEVPPGLRALADAELIYRVIQNLLNNALKFTPEGGRVTISGRAEEGKKAVLSIQDTGPGIDPSEFPHIFDRYHQAAARRRGKIQGTGLGLAFCAEAMRVMKGDIALQSRPGAGCEFTVRLSSA